MTAILSRPQYVQGSIKLSTEEQRTHRYSSLLHGMKSEIFAEFIFGFICLHYMHPYEVLKTSDHHSYDLNGVTGV